MKIKKIISSLMICALIIGICDCVAVAGNHPGAQPPRAESESPEAAEIVVTPEPLVLPEADPAMLKAYGFAETLEYTPEPTSDAEHWDNFFISFILGQWDYISETDKSELQWIGGELADYAKLYPEMLGAFLNQTGFTVVMADNAYFICTNGIEPLYTAAEINQQQTHAYEAARALLEQFKTEGRIKDDMSEKETAQAVHDYLRSLNIQPSKLDTTSGDYQYRTGFMEYDTAYAALVSGKADCGGRSAAYNLLMHLCNIKAYGVSGQMGGGGHILSYSVLDGVEYFSDYSNGLHFEEISTKNSRFEPFGMALYRARKAAGVGFTSDEDYFIVNGIREDEDHVYVACSLADDFKEDPHQQFEICYGVEGNYVFMDGFPVSALKAGVEVPFRKSEIARWSIPRNIFIQTGRQYLELPSPAIVSHFRVDEISSNEQFMLVKCRVDNSYQGENRSYFVVYGLPVSTSGSNCVWEELSLEQLQAGVELEVPMELIEQYTIPQCVFLLEDAPGA